MRFDGVPPALTGAWGKRKDQIEYAKGRRWFSAWLERENLFLIFKNIGGEQVPQLYAAVEPREFPLAFWRHRAAGILVRLASLRPEKAKRWGRWDQELAALRDFGSMVAVEEELKRRGIARTTFQDDLKNMEGVMKTMGEADQKKMTAIFAALRARGQKDVVSAYEKMLVHDDPELRMSPEEVLGDLEDLADLRNVDTAWTPTLTPDIPRPAAPGKAQEEWDSVFGPQKPIAHGPEYESSLAALNAAARQVKPIEG